MRSIQSPTLWTLESNVQCSEAPYFVDPNKNTTFFYVSSHLNSPYSGSACDWMCMGTFWVAYEVTSGGSSLCSMQGPTASGWLKRDPKRVARFKGFICNCWGPMIWIMVVHTLFIPIWRRRGLGFKKWGEERPSCLVALWSYDSTPVDPWDSERLRHRRTTLIARFHRNTSLLHNWNVALSTLLSHPIQMALIRKRLKLWSAPNSALARSLTEIFDTA